MYTDNEKKTEKFPKFSQNENIFVKIGELFANFDQKKNPNFPIIFVSTTRQARHISK